MSTKALKRPSAFPTTVSGRRPRAPRLHSEAHELLDEGPAEEVEQLVSVVECTEERLDEAAVEQESSGVGCEVATCTPANLDDIDPESMTDAERQKYKKLKWAWCKDCGGGSICKVGWAHKNRANHDVCSLKDAGKVDDAIKEFLFIHRGGRAAQEALTKAKRQNEAGQIRSNAPPG